MTRLALLPLVLVLAACGPPQVAVRLSIPGLDGEETPLPGIVIMFLPYNRDSIIASLEARGKPRPNMAPLDSLFRVFRGPFTALVTATRDHDRLQARLDSLRARSTSPETAKLMRGLRDSLATQARTLAQARTEVDSARRTIWPVIDSLRAEYQAWERTAHQGYRGMVERYLGRHFVNTVSDTTGADGWAEMILTTGDWWVTAHAIDPRDPNAEWYWNLPVKGDTMYLNPKNGLNRPRY